MFRHSYLIAISLIGFTSLAFADEVAPNCADKAALAATALAKVEHPDGNFSVAEQKRMHHSKKPSEDHTLIWDLILSEKVTAKVYHYAVTVAGEDCTIASVRLR